MPRPFKNLPAKTTYQMQTEIVVVTAALQRANKELAEGNPKAAIHFGEIASKFEPERLETKVLLGKSYLALKEHHKAQKILTTVSESDLTGELLELRGISKFFALDYSAAKSDLEHALKLDETRWQGSAVLGRLAYQDGDIKNSQKWFDQAMKHTENERTVFNHQGFAYYEAGDWYKANEAFDRVFNPPNPDNPAHLAYRVSKAKTGDIAGALNLASDIESAELYRELGRIALESGDRVEAVKYLRRAKSLSPKYDTETERLLAAAKAMKG